MVSQIGFVVRHVICLFFTFTFLTNVGHTSQWTKFAKGTNFSEYYGNISKSGRMASVDCLRDYAKESVKKEQKYLSKMHSLKFDCGRKKFREMSIQYFEKNMMSGALLKKKILKSDWEQVDPNSLNELLFKKACR